MKAAEILAKGRRLGATEISQRGKALWRKAPSGLVGLFGGTAGALCLANLNGRIHKYPTISPPLLFKTALLYIIESYSHISPSLHQHYFNTFILRTHQSATDYQQP